MYRSGMKRSNIAFIISIAIHGLALLLFINYHFESEFKKTSGSVAVDLSAKVTNATHLPKRQNLEPVRRVMFQNPTDTPNRPVELTTAVRVARTPADRGTVSLKQSFLPTDMSLPATGTIGNFSGRGFQPRETQRTLAERKSQLVDFVDKLRGKREIIYCMDISASMGAPGSNKLNLARNYLVDSLTALTEQDSFNIIVFSKDAKVFHSGGTIIATKENISSAVEFLSQYTPQNIKSNIKTDLLNAIILALGMKPNVVVAVTDGLPTVGVIQPEKILQDIREANFDAKIFAIGMEMDQELPEAWLMKSIADQNNGEFQLLN